MLWIVFGCIFAGAVHDYFSGMLSVRARGASVPTVVGEHLGNAAKHFMNLFAVVLLMLVGVVFVLSPAGLLANLTSTDLVCWIAAIFAYYILATIVPIDKIIGRFYPIFGALLVFMSVGLIIGLMVSGKASNTGMDFSNLHPTELPLWPLLFITIACGAVSGFHATQSPLMARCMQNESSGRFIFYGAMMGRHHRPHLVHPGSLLLRQHRSAQRHPGERRPPPPWYTRSPPACSAQSAASWPSSAW